MLLDDQRLFFHRHKWDDESNFDACRGRAYVSFSVIFGKYSCNFDTKELGKFTLNDTYAF